MAGGRTIEQPIKPQRSRRFFSSWLTVRLHWAFPIAASITVFCCYARTLNPFNSAMIGGGDTPDHLLTGYLLARSIEAKDNVFGPIGLDLGAPFLRFYQPLFYLHNLALNLATGLDVRFLHNLTLAVFFSLSPLAYCYCLLKLGLPRFAAGFGAMLSMISVAGFGNSFEAYHGCGIVTQSMGAVFFPLFMGVFADFLDGKNRTVIAALLFALAFLSHAIMAVYAVFAGALYFLATPVSILKNWKRLAAFAALGACLVAFWALPFLDHTAQMRPEPDSVTRGVSKRWWFYGVTNEEFVDLAISGRLFDDARTRHKAQTEPLDKLTDKINITGSSTPRPPVVTILVGLGIFAALISFRRRYARFLLTGLAFSFFLFIGPDDHSWLRLLPFMNHIQSFRCTYLVEFFAFGLVGIGIEGTLGFLWRLFGGAAQTLRRAGVAAIAVVVVGGAVLCVANIAMLGQRYVRVHDPQRQEARMDALSSLQNKGYPFRMHILDTADAYDYHLGANGFRPVCTHWGSVGPSLALNIMGYLSRNPLKTGTMSLAGVRYLSGVEKFVGKVIDKNDKNGFPIWRRVPNGPDRRGRDNSGQYVLESNRDGFLRPLAGAALPVVCRDSHWFWLIKYWLEKYGGNPGAGDTPVPMRVGAGGLSESGLLKSARVLLYLGEEPSGSDREALRAFADEGKTVVSPVTIDSLETTPLKRGQSLWDTISKILKKKKNNAGRKVRPEEEETGGGRLFAKMHIDPKKSNQRYMFDVDVMEPIVAVLPTQAAPGWTASLDGEPLRVFPTGPDMVGTLLPKGAHRLAFEWKMPLKDKLALAASLAALAFVLGAWAFPFFAGRKRKER